jgi:ribosomal-protein-alanine N-acetyltransferase
MSEGVIIRHGTPADLREVMEIAEQSDTAAHWRVPDYNGIFVTPRTLLVAETESGIVGFAITHNIAGEWELENIAVEAVYQRRGLGGQLITAVIKEAKNSNAKFIFLEVRESNSAAKRLYQRCGFQQYGRRKSYYSDPPEDAVLYRFLCNPEMLENC